MNSVAASKPRSRRGLSYREAHPEAAATVLNSVAATPSRRPGPRRDDAQSAPARAATQSTARIAGAGGGHGSADSHRSLAPADLLAVVVDLYRVRRRFLKAEGGSTRWIKSAERGSASFRQREQGLAPTPGKMPVPTAADVAVVATVYSGFYEALAILRKHRRREERALTKAVEPLPIMSWARRVWGLGPLSVGTLIGEAGDPGAYSNPAKLWKRYGLAVIDGGRQRRVSGAEDALRHGYSAQRRSALHVIGGNLIRMKNVHARELYDRVKARELAKEGITKGHAHMRALRIVEKELVVAFWLAWRNPDDPPPSAMAWCATGAAAPVNPEDGAAHHEIEQTITELEEAHG